MSNFLLGSDTKQWPNQQLRQWVWTRQEVNAVSHRITVTVDYHDYGTFYWYWAEPLTEEAS